MAGKILSNIFGNDLDDLVEASDLSDGYVPFVSGTTFADSPIYISSGNVLVGSPSDSGSLLQLYKSTSVIIEDTGDGVGNLIFKSRPFGTAKGAIQFFCDNNIDFGSRDGTQRLILDHQGSIKLGTTNSPTGTVAKIFVFGDAGGDPTPGTDTACFYAKDVSGTVETFTADEAGNVTQLSDHAPEWPEELEVSETYPQVKTDENKFLGIKRYIALGRMAELVEELSHKAGLLPADKKLVVYEATGEKLDWDSVQAEHVQNREKEIQSAEKSRAEIEKQIAEIDAGLNTLTKQFSGLKTTEPVNVLGGDTILAEQIVKLKQRIAKAEKTKEDLERRLAKHVIPEPLTVKPMPKWIADRLKAE